MERLGRMDVRYSRQIALTEVGELGQERLAKASVLVIGAGGLGAPILLYLVAMGVGRIGLVDDDLVCLSNLQRQILYTSEQVGKSKAREAYARLHALNPNVQLDIYDTRLSEDNADEIVSGYDIFVDASDSYETRLLIDLLSLHYRRPYVYGSVDGFCGQISVFNHRGAGSYHDFVGVAEYSRDSERAISVPGALPGVVGSLQAMEVLKLIVGCGEPLCGKLLCIDLLHNEYKLFSL